MRLDASFPRTALAFFGAMLVGIVAGDVLSRLMGHRSCSLGYIESTSLPAMAMLCFTWFLLVPRQLGFIPRTPGTFLRRMMGLPLLCTLSAAVLFQPALMGPPRQSR